MRKFFLALFLANALLCFSQVNKPGKVGSKVLLPNGWSLSPAGRSIPLGDLPLNIAVSSSKKWMAVTNNGQSTQTLQLIDVKMKNSWIGRDTKELYGLKFGSNDKYLYASGGNDNWILKYEIVNNRLKLRDSLILGKKWPNKISPAGFDIDEARQLLYVVTKENNRLYIVNLKTKQKTDSLPLGGEGYTSILSPDKRQLYISCWVVINSSSSTPGKNEFPVNTSWEIIQTKYASVKMEHGCTLPTLTITAFLLST
jgi:DNA-binding beta-propeller fold protein YncE